MTREDHIKELLDALRGYTICMCPASKEYWRQHWKEIRDALELIKKGQGEKQ